MLILLHSRIICVNNISLVEMAFPRCYNMPRPPGMRKCRLALSAEYTILSRVMQQI